MNVFFIITARGGSKGVPGKNIRVISGLPLIAYKIIAAQRCGFLGRIVVSTDSEEIAKVALDYNAEVPFIRPAALASDTANSMDVVAHALEWLENNDNSHYDYVCLLEPSSPFATPQDLHNALELIQINNADTVLGMKEVDVSRRFICELDENGGLSNLYNELFGNRNVRRQDQKPEYTMNGCMYIARYDYFKKHKSFHSLNSLPYIMPEEKSIEIDNMNQLFFAEFCVERGIIDTTLWN